MESKKASRAAGVSVRMRAQGPVLLTSADGYGTDDSAAEIQT